MPRKTVVSKKVVKRPISQSSALKEAWDKQPVINDKQSPIQKISNMSKIGTVPVKNVGIAKGLSDIAKQSKSNYELQNSRLSGSTSGLRHPTRGYLMERGDPAIPRKNLKTKKRSSSVLTARSTVTVPLSSRSLAKKSRTSSRFTLGKSRKKPEQIGKFQFWKSKKLSETLARNTMSSKLLATRTGGREPSKSLRMKVCRLLPSRKQQVA